MTIWLTKRFGLKYTRYSMFYMGGFEITGILHLAFFQVVFYRNPT